MSRSPMRLGDPLGHLVAEVGEVEAVAAAVEDALGVVHLAVAQQVDDRCRASGSWVVLAGPGGRGGAAAGQGVEHRLHGAVVVGGGEEPRLVRRRREVDAAVEHRVEERGVRRRVGARTRRRSRAPAGR